ncbi:MAG: hypothetical protein M3550_14055, partial [Actinomycetota bacterium]|nr:hypothetical protein [Actinomycetota bacterium]
APESQSLAEGLQCALGIGVQLSPSAREEIFEAVDVALAGTDVQPVGAARVSSPPFRPSVWRSAETWLCSIL